MPSEMAKMAFEEFELFHNSFESVASEPGLFRSSEPDVSDEVWTFADAYRFWLRSGGLKTVSFDYGIAVETLLHSISMLSSTELPLRPPLQIGDDGFDWDFITQAGFNHECVQFRLNLKTTGSTP